MKPNIQTSSYSSSALITTISLPPIGELSISRISAELRSKMKFDFIEQVKRGSLRTLNDYDV